MKIAVVGLGGVGGYLAACFAKAGFDVTGFARGEHLQAIQRDGLKIIEDENEWSVHLKAQELREAETLFDIVIFCVKSYDIAESYRQIASCVSEKTILISFSNGVNNGDILCELSKAKVLEGAVYILSYIEKPGVVRKKGKVFAAIFGGEKASTETLAALFEKSGLRYKTPEDIKTALWKKYIFISAFATLTSYYDKPIAVVYKEHRDEAEELLREIAAVAKEQGVNIDDEVQKALETASKLPEDASTSMHLDFQNGKRVELESLSGLIAKSDKAPLMLRMYNALKKRE
ncbi:ketopantoate reductase family protein [Sulfurimonas paralvinellae]|uniref:2-dehydropantoate 2-reductase n=1 Tax=Sulfurimonas paralvinellae TaxID=317658 RepID=A0A7M1B5C0_9BACT|nr:2-dehydropantoate 2-reductase [Sulfurimonas paralvinellae]QOP44870.1 2-dehydropantoate 2-reductase [Sulfurimonas paralvinellae]